MKTTDSAQASEPAAPKVGELQDLVGYQLRRAFLKSNQLFTEMMAETAISPGHYSILRIVELNDGLSQRELASAAGIDPSTLTPILDKLEAQGFVARSAGRDRRSVAVRCTERGHRMSKIAAKHVQDHEAKLLKGLPPRERTLLASLLSKVASQV